MLCFLWHVDRSHHCVWLFAPTGSCYICFIFATIFNPNCITQKTPNWPITSTILVAVKGRASGTNNGRTINRKGWTQELRCKSFVNRIVLGLWVYMTLKNKKYSSQFYVSSDLQKDMVICKTMRHDIHKDLEKALM